MNPITFLYHEVLFRPIFNLLVGITHVLPTHSIGFAIILVTIIIRLILLPSSLHHARQQQKNQTKMAALKGELESINAKYKDDSVKRAEVTMALYRKAGINPASGCLPLLIQLPILLALYKVFLVGLGPDTLQHLYSFVPAPGNITSLFFSVDLAIPSLGLGILAGVAQFLQMRFFNPAPQAGANLDKNSEQMMLSMQKNMMYIFPVMTVFIAMRLPAALALYWFVSTVLAIGQQYIIKRSMHLESAPPTI